MSTISRVPECQNYSFDGMLQWFAELSERDLMFHPDDDPATLFSTKTGQKLFSRFEAKAARLTIGECFKANGDEVYEAAYPSFMKRFGNQLDA